MGVGAEVTQGVLGSAEGPLGVDDPVVTVQDSEPCREAAWLSEWGEVAMELELAFTERSLQACDELTAEDSAKHLHAQEESAV